MKPKALVVEHDLEFAAALCTQLKDIGFRVRHAASSEQALEGVLREESFHLAICDLLLPGLDGVGLIQKLSDLCPSTRTILLTGRGTTNSVTLAFRRGAFNYYRKPLKPRQLQKIYEQIRSEQSLYLPNQLLRGSHEPQEFAGLLASEPTTLAMLDQARNLAPLHYPVLIIGEPGAGKSALAEAIHQRSLFSNGPFVILRTATLLPKRIERTIFGIIKDGSSGVEHQLGAVEQAATGTLYIDDVTQLDLRSQALLHELVETGNYARAGDPTRRPINVRVVVGAPADLTPRLERNEIHPGLYYALQSHIVQVPPLRARRNELLMLAHHLLTQLHKKKETTATNIAADAQQLLLHYPWPGNLTELESVLQRASLGIRGRELRAYHLPAPPRNSEASAPMLILPIGTSLREIQRETIVQTLLLTSGNRKKASELLGLSRRALYRRQRRLFPTTES